MIKKKNTIQKVFLILFATLTIFSCQKKDDVAAVKTGSFTVDGTTYSGPCTLVTSTSCSTGSDVGITSQTGTSNFLVTNMPSASSGTFTFNNGLGAAGTCNLWGAYVTSASQVYPTKTGTITKTGAKSFTFSCTVYDLNTNINKTVTGSGNY